MRVTNGAVALFATLALTACGTKTADQPGADTQPVTETQPPSDTQPVSDPMAKTTYNCTDGSVVEASYPTPDTAKLVYQGRTIDMTIAVAASGARYVGGDMQWWTKGMTEGMLAPLAKGETIASASGVNCTAT